MMRSLWAGVTGLQAHQIAMDVEGHNIANVNTNGFKYGRANFSDLMSQTAKVATAPQGELGGKNPMQIGLGTQVNSVTKIFKQGSVQTTDKNTDLAIQGDGFFVISPDGGKTYKYTRNGDFVRDAKGNFVDNNGYIAQGWLRDEVTGEVDITAPVKNIVIKPGLTTPANPTSYITLKANLNSGNEIGDKRTPIYTLDSQHDWMDINKDGLKVDSGVHKENDISKDVFLTTKDRELRLKERGVDMGVLFNRAGESFNLRSGQGVWVSYAQAKTKPLELHGISDTGKFEGGRNLSININGITIKQTVNSISEILAAINAKTKDTGVSANIIDGTKLQLINDNKFGTTSMSKNIKVKEDGDVGSDTTGLFGHFVADDAVLPAGAKVEEIVRDGESKRYLRSSNVSAHRDGRLVDQNGQEIENRDKWVGIEVVTAYQYVYDVSPVSTDHNLNDRIERKFHTTEDLREAMQKDARLWVNYTGDQVSDSNWAISGSKNDGVRVEVGDKGQFMVFNPAGDAKNADDGDTIDLTSEGINSRIEALWRARQNSAAAIQPLAEANDTLTTETQTLNTRIVALNDAKTAVQNSKAAIKTATDTLAKLEPQIETATADRAKKETAKNEAERLKTRTASARDAALQTKNQKDQAVVTAQGAVDSAQQAVNQAQQELDTALAGVGDAEGTLANALAQAQQTLQTKQGELQTAKNAQREAEADYNTKNQAATNAESDYNTKLAAFNTANNTLTDLNRQKTSVTQELTNAQNALPGQERTLAEAQTAHDEQKAIVDAATRRRDTLAEQAAELSNLLDRYGAQPSNNPADRYDLAGIPDNLLDVSWEDLQRAGSHDMREVVYAAFKEHNDWVSKSYNYDENANDYNMFLNVSNLSNPEKGINENDKFMKTMQGVQGALALGDYSRETQGLYLSAHSSALDVYDSLGTKHQIKFDFTKTGYTDDGGTEWNMVIQVPEPCEINLNGDGPKNVLTGSIRFNSDGSLQGFNPTSISFTANNGSTPNQNIDLNFGNTNDFDGLTSYDRESNTSGISQDGFSGGDLNGIRVDESGTIIGSFTNGRSFGLAQIAMATFTNNEGLEADGGNVFSQTSNSGEPVIGAATTGGRGKVQASSLEMSNVDLSRSLTQLIVIQRGYQANSKTITTSDQMLNTLLQLKQ